MPGKKVARLQSRASSVFEDGSEPQLSQKTTGSDSPADHEMYAAAAKEMKGSFSTTTPRSLTKSYAAAWLKEHKEIKERERKALRTTEKRLDKCLQDKQDEIGVIMKEIEKIYTAFLLEYAMVEDKKRKITTEILAKGKVLIPLAVQRHQAIIALGYKIEDGQLKGMGKVKAACKDFTDLANSLL
ncbi:hypothetical protein BV22DRAFT_1195923 [Leucogyrophana mollusca]|uniref:Uncharacterized protein n=1 Tax=Leucogyrophana mollusca TaxID=85980 RepID=A0ACB8BI10_9AGAM|nr:hypothetical protein BV22DRAFT_1195923 [Leucogyrophana mollusca]